MKFHYLIMLLVLGFIVNAEEEMIVVSEGTTKGVEYVLKIDKNKAGRIYPVIKSRLDRDARISFTILPGIGDRGIEPKKVIILSKNTTWNDGLKKSITCDYVRPGFRVDEIEFGIISNEYGEYVNSNGEEIESNIIKFRPDNPSYVK